MRTTFRIITLATIGFLYTAPAIGALQVDPVDSRLTHDTNTGLTWLDLTETTGLSYDDVEAGAGGWTAAGFRHATGSEVCNLFNTYLSLTIDPCPKSTIVSGLGNQLPLIGDYLGVTWPAVPSTRGMFDDGDGGPDVGRAGLSYNSQFNTTPAWVIPNDTPSSASDLNHGHFLVREPPGVPSAATSECPTPFFSDMAWIPVVGTQGGAVHGSLPGSTDLSVVIVVRDGAGDPVTGSEVEIDYSACTDISLCEAVVMGAGVVTCGPSGPVGNVVHATTNALGEVKLSVVGAAINVGPPIPTPGTPNGCVVIRADGVQLCVASSYVLDSNGALGPSENGMDGLDLTNMETDVLNNMGPGTYVARAAFDMNSVSPSLLTGLDIARAAKLALESQAGFGSATGCPQPYCP